MTCAALVWSNDNRFISADHKDSGYQDFIHVTLVEGQPSCGDIVLNMSIDGQYKSDLIRSIRNNRPVYPAD